jgi:hypothetical protein
MSERAGLVREPGGGPCRCPSVSGTRLNRTAPVRLTGRLLFGALAIAMFVLAIGSLVAVRKAGSSKGTDHH